MRQGILNRRAFPFLVASLAAVVLSGPVAGHQSQRDTRLTEPRKVFGSISGTVVSADHGRPVRRAVVTLSGGEPRFARSMQTDDQGAFSFTNLPAGEYTVTTSKGGYIESVWGQRRPGSGRPGTPIRLLEGQQLTKLTVPLARGGVITGTVVDEAGEPVFGMAVRALRWVMRSGERSLQAAGTAVTDDRGVYRLHSLLPGEYVISAQPNAGISIAAAEGLNYAKLVGAIELSMSEVIVTKARVAERETSAPATSGFATVYFPGTTSGLSAASVTVGAGEERAGIDIALQVVPLTSVTGLVLSPTGPASGTSVQLVDRDQVAGMPARTSRTDANGRFRFDGVAPGQYTLLSKGSAKGAPQLEASAREAAAFLEAQIDKSGKVVAARLAGVSPLWAMTDVAVDGRGQTDVQLVLQPGMSVSGRVSFEGGQPPSLSRLSLGLTAVGVSKTAGDFAMAGPAPVDEHGQFTIRGVAPGRYRLTVMGGLPAGFTLQSAMFGGRDILDIPLEVDGSRNFDGGIVSFSTGRTEISGIILDESSRAAPGFTVMAFPADERLWTPDSRRIQATQPASDGRYVFRNLPPGDYRLIAVQDVEVGRWFDPGYLRQLAGFATITLGPGARYVQDFRVK